MGHLVDHHRMSWNMGEEGIHDISHQQGKKNGKGVVPVNNRGMAVFGVKGVQLCLSF